jgi:hypothetical protein
MQRFRASRSFAHPNEPGASRCENAKADLKMRGSFALSYESLSASFLLHYLDFREPMKIPRSVDEFLQITTDEYIMHLLG